MAKKKKAKPLVEVTKVVVSKVFNIKQPPVRFKSDVKRVKILKGEK